MTDPDITVVGVCASGKTTLVNALLARGYRARQVAQEHSYVPDLWQRNQAPDVLIYLDAALETIRRRRRDDQWPEWLRHHEIERLLGARAQCNLYIGTDGLSPEEILRHVLAYLTAL